MEIDIPERKKDKFFGSVGLGIRKCSEIRLNEINTASFLHQYFDCGFFLLKTDNFNVSNKIKQMREFCSKRLWFQDPI